MSRQISDPHSVLLICHSYPPVLGGTEIEAQRVCSALIARGHRVTVVCAGGEPMPRQRRWTDPFGVPVEIYGHSGSPRLRDYTYTLGVAWSLLKNRHRFNVAYFLMPGLHLTLGIPVARLFGMKIVMKFSGSNEVRKLLNSRLGRFNLALLRRWAHRILVLNDGMKEEAREARLPMNAIGWMPNPVDLDEFSPAPHDERNVLRQRFQIQDGCIAVLFVGRLAPEKELGSLLEAFARAAKRFGHLRLILVGDGPQRHILEEATNQLGIRDRVRFVGRVPVSEVKLWMQASDIFALVSSLEGFPCSLLEAMAVGMASVVSAIPANRQLVVDRKNGVITPVGDADRLSESLIGLAQDPAMRAQLGAQARQTVIANYSTSQVIGRYEMLFAELVNGRR